MLKRSLSVVCFGSCYFCVSVQPLCDVISICQINEIFVWLSWQPPVAPLTLPMAPPSPSTNSSTNNSSSSSSTTGWEQLSKTNLYIRGLPPGTTDHDLAKICQPWVLAVMSWQNLQQCLLESWMYVQPNKYSSCSVLLLPWDSAAQQGWRLLTAWNVRLSELGQVLG